MTRPYARCLRCRRAVEDHPHITEWMIEATARASWDEPVYIDGWTFYAPLSPSLIGQYHGHDPLVAPEEATR